MKRRSVIFNLALIAVFGGLGLTQFTEGVRTVQILGLFASGAVVGNLFSTIIHTLKPTQKS